MLADRPLHPTMWIRMWFADGDKLHQRGYTLVDPDPTNDTVDIEFALHDGIASDWAQRAQPGDTIEVTVLGSNFGLPEPPPAGYVIVGDTASLPAINSLLSAIGEAPAQVFLEAGHDDDKQLPVARSTDVTWVDRKNAGEALVEAVKTASFDASDHFGWVACDNRTTRAVAKVLREDYKIGKKSIKAQGLLGGLTGPVTARIACWAARSAPRTPRASTARRPRRVREQHQRRHDTHQPARPVRDRVRVVAPQRDNERLGERLDHLGLLGHLRADRTLRRGEPRGQCRAFAHVAQRGEHSSISRSRGSVNELICSVISR